MFAGERRREELAEIHSEELLEEFEVKSFAISWDNFQGGSHFIEIYREKVEKSSLEVHFQEI